MNHIEAMKQALEALEHSQRFVEASANAKMLNGWGEQLETAEEAITSLRQAIAEAEKQEPRCAVIVEVFGKDWRLDYMSLPVGKHKLYTQEYVYTAPPAQPAKQEPVLKPCWYESKEKTMCRKCGQVHAEATPPAAQPAPAHEPDYKNLFERMCQQHDMVVDKLKAAQRTWVGLTDEEIGDFASGYRSGRIGSFVELTEAIEAKLKEKNK